MELVFDSEKVRKQCTDVKTAKKLFGGDEKAVEKLFARINMLEQAL